MKHRSKIKSNKQGLLEKVLEYSREHNSRFFFKRLDAYHDEPRMFHYAARSVIGSDGIVGGVGAAFDERRAQMKALGEFWERKSLGNSHCFKRDGLRGVPVADLSGLCEFENPAAGGALEDVHLNWTVGYDFKTQKKVRIPAQLVFVPYKFGKNEPVIRPPISTGAAAGATLEDAILGGLLEIVERDAFVISYFDKKVRCQIDISKDESLRKIEAELARCELRLTLLDISSNAGAYVFLALVRDDTGFGPPLSAGLKAGFDPYRVALGAIEESLQSRGWIRDIMFSDEAQPKPKEVVTILDRVRYWLNPKLLDRVGYYFNCRKKRNINSFPAKNNSLKGLIGKLPPDANIFVIDLTPDKASPLKVVRVIVPELQPLYLDESRAVLGDRVRNKKCAVPHFFL